MSIICSTILLQPMFKDRRIQTLEEICASATGYTRKEQLTTRTGVQRWLVNIVRIRTSAKQPETEDK